LQRNNLTGELIHHSSQRAFATPPMNTYEDAEKLVYDLVACYFIEAPFPPELFLIKILFLGDLWFPKYGQNFDFWLGFWIKKLRPL
jgi:hypothetical protein